MASFLVLCVVFVLLLLKKLCSGGRFSKPLEKKDYLLLLKKTFFLTGGQGTLGKLKTEFNIHKPNKHKFYEVNATIK